MTSIDQNQGQSKAEKADAEPRAGSARVVDVGAPPAMQTPVFLGADRYINREMSWLRFNGRVMEEAMGTHNPLLERLNFLSISSSNLDEFFMKRVGGLLRQLKAGVTRRTNDGRTPGEQLAILREMLDRMVREQCELWNEELTPSLRREGIHIAAWDELNSTQRHWLTEYFDDNILPILTPLGVGPGQPFPFISNLSLSLGVRVRSPQDREQRFARVKVPSNRPRWIQIGTEMTFIAQEELIASNMERLFPGMEILESVAFRVTRNADIERSEEEAEDLLEMIEEELRNRRFAPIVRLETSVKVSHEMLTWLVEELKVDPKHSLYQSSAPLGLVEIKELNQIDRMDLRFPPHSPVSHPRLSELESDSPDRNIFDIIRNGDLLVHHPYQSFTTSVLGMLQAAAEDPRVLAIKQTLYRTAKNSPIVAALLKAAENGKEINVQVEIKARFDEANNIEWVRKLEKAGVHVTYGLVNLKTHTKTLLVVRDEPDGIRRYAHVGTGNYHTGTARSYTDVGLLTCDEAICQDIADLFNYLTGHSRFKNYKKLLLAPFNMRARFVEMIRREIRHQQEHGTGRILAKMNQLEDTEIIDTLYEASQAGVQIDCIVRGFTCLRPGVPGLSENIRIMSVVGRFLEHSRIFRFENNGAPEFYIGSADWMSRNLDWRVEAIAPVEAPALQAELDYILKTVMADRSQAWDMQPDGSFKRRRPRRGKGSQNLFIGRYAKK